jgi:hypothetical protein
MKKLFVFVAILLMTLGMGTKVSADMLDPDQITYVCTNASTAIYDGRPDNTGDDLANGYINGLIDGLELNNDDWVECLAGPQLIFNLGAKYSLNTISLAMFHAPTWGLHAPSSLDVAYSDDGINFGPTFSLTGFDDSTPAGYCAVVITDFAVTGSAQYVKIAVNPWTTDAWMHLGEVMFDVPEPATMSMLGLGLLGLIRRKK